MPGSSLKHLPLWRLGLWIVLISAALIYYLMRFEETDGHSEDLLPQWTLAHLAVTGHRADSYDYVTQKALLDAEVPPHRAQITESPHIREIGVSPYPPTMVVLYAPLGLLSYPQAAQAMYIVTLALAALAAAAIGGATRGRVSALAAFAAILWYPGFNYNILLGQNAALTLALLAMGWCGLVHGWDIAAGIAWGLLAYKPHWLVAVIWLPLLLRRWRCVIAAIATAGGLAGFATLWLGPEAWARWLTQVQAQDTVAYTNEAFRLWILGMACDVRGVINRYLPESTLAKPLGWAALAVIGIIGLGLTSRSLRRPAESLDEEPAAPAWLATMCLVIPYLYYYDEVVLLLPLLVLWSQRARLAWWQIGLLAAITIGYYVALPEMLYRDPNWRPPPQENGLPDWAQPRPMGWLGGPNWALVAALALWGLSLTVRGDAQSRLTLR